METSSSCKMGRLMDGDSGGRWWRRLIAKAKAFSPEAHLLCSSSKLSPCSNFPWPLPPDVKSHVVFLKLHRGPLKRFIPRQPFPLPRQRASSVAHKAASDLGLPYFHIMRSLKTSIAPPIRRRQRGAGVCSLAAHCMNSNLWAGAETRNRYSCPNAADLFLSPEADQVPYIERA